MLKIKKIYQDRYKKYGIDPKSLCWHEKGAAHQRFRQFWAEIDFDNKSVLDVGCGFGEMAKFLKKRYEGVSYTGVDIVPEFIRQSKEDFPEYRFLTRDYFADPLQENFDVVLASGVLNSNLPAGKSGVTENMEYRKEAIKVMFSHTKKVLAFNMLGGHPAPKTNPKSNVWYANSLEVLEYCMSLTRRVILRANYHPTDFTIFMYPIKNHE
jgi:SAM-dependent methyltransferase